MSPGRVVLVGFEDQDNLGIRYLSARLRKAGHQTRIVAVSTGADPVLAAITEMRPHIVGFSLIFQFLVPQFAEIVRRVRATAAGVHLTIGGHYASFEPGTLLDAIPELDSVVRFEGEDTLLEILERLVAGQDWRGVPGIAFRSGTTLELTSARVGRAELDELPWPDRDDIDYRTQRLPTASVIGGRGCPWVCSFCSIITFYEANGTKGRRRRDPACVVDEVEYLVRERGVQIVLWQDDDFLAGGRLGVRWAHEIAAECLRRGLNDTMRWKISCRSDEISLPVFEPLVEAGLTHVYMGIESADPHDLEDLNKHLRPEVHHRAGEVLRALGLSFDFGFMLLQPWSTFGSVRNNIEFLRDFTADGAASVSFCRTLPYAGTPIEDRLRREGRLIERDFEADYRFLDPRLDVFYDWTLRAFAEHNFSGSGTAAVLRRMLFEAHLDRAPGRSSPGFRDAIHALTAVSNSVLLAAVEQGLDYIESTPGAATGDGLLEALAAAHADEDRRIKHDISLLTSSAA